jgi:hypothetical protein
MALEKQTYVDQITVTENGTVLVRETTKILEDNIELSKQYHRISLEPDSDTSNQPENVQAICKAAWTPEIIAAYKAQQETVEA